MVEVPKEYFCHMDGQGSRADKFQRPELCCGSYEFIATAEYCRVSIYLDVTFWVGMAASQTIYRLRERMRRNIILTPKGQVVAITVLSTGDAPLRSLLVLHFDDVLYFFSSK